MKNEELMKEGGRLWCNIDQGNTIETRLRANKKQSEQNNIIVEKADHLSDFYQRTGEYYNRGLVRRGIYHSYAVMRISDPWYGR